MIVVTGAGDRAFVSGADISEFGERRTSVDARAEYDAAMADALAHVARARQADPRDDPRLLHRRRAARGACAPTFGIAAEGSQFAVPAARLGLGYAFGGVEELVALVGPVVGGGDPVLRAAAVRPTRPCASGW